MGKIYAFVKLGAVRLLIEKHYAIFHRIIIARTRHLLFGIELAMIVIKTTIFTHGSLAMFKRFLEIGEAMLRAATYFMVLVIGLSVACLGAFTIVFMSIRIGEFLWDFCLKNRWLN